MTENEAIEIIKTVNEDYFQPDNPNEFDDINESFEIAIQALEEIQQYRTIGTVEGYEKAIQSSIEYYNLMKEYKTKMDEFEAIGTIEEFKSLKEKSVAKKPITYKNTNRADCPNCGATVRGIDKPFGDYCSKCGVKLDWSE